MIRNLIAAAALLASSCLALAQSAPVKIFSAASLNPNVVLGRAAILGSGVIVNTTTTTYYLKFYDKATAPTCGTDIPKWTVPIPASTAPAQGVVSLPLNQGLIFASGIGICLTGGLADADVTNAATGVAINLGVSAR